MDVQVPLGKKLIVSSTESVTRLASDKAKVARELDHTQVQEHLGRVVKPKSVAGGMKKVGLLLMASPDPITDVPGVALLASSYMMKKKEPANLGHLAHETKKLLRELQSLRI